ncbi:hypothetical protein [Tenacibaculum sp. 190130A14a]|uniref:DUF1795 domain-containing protein n=1 Tax=Tenacibaculum polynesiense TaxID=3137857 RepID=A0ABP1F6U6_9FLAO
MRKIISSLFLIITSVVFGQEEGWLKYDKNGVEISYPKTWRLDTSGQMNSTFILFSELDENDTFQENVNLLVQDLKNQGFTLTSYTKLSEVQIKTMVPEGKLIESKLIKGKELDYQQTVWQGKIGENLLQFKQYYFLKDEKAYVLTLTTLPNTYDGFIEIGNQVLNSFHIK